MKDEYVDPKHKTPSAMFPGLHNHHHHFHLSPDSEETARSSATSSANATPGAPKPSGDGATVEVPRRPRGRPPGSKNKPKPPVFVAAEPPMRPYILEISAGNDVVDAISSFSRRRNLGVCVLAGSGAVANVTLRQPSAGSPPPGLSSPTPAITFHGRFEILSLSATIFPQAQTLPFQNAFAISLAGPQGQIIGGFVAGSLIAAETVYVIAASFDKPSYHRLPGDEEGSSAGATNGSGGRDRGRSQQVPGGDGHVGGGGGGSEPCGPAMYDVIWAPNARPPPPPPAPY